MSTSTRLGWLILKLEVITPPLVEVGDSFLSARTMFADNPQQPYGVPIQIWDDFKNGKELVDGPYIGDMNVARIQLPGFAARWPARCKRLAISNEAQSSSRDLCD